MCPLCILTAISLGGGSALAGGVNWVRAKLGRGEDEVCQSLCLQTVAKENADPKVRVSAGQKTDVSE